jgi:hypothetical protein
MCCDFFFVNIFRGSEKAFLRNYFLIFFLCLFPLKKLINKKIFFNKKFIIINIYYSFALDHFIFSSAWFGDEEHVIDTQTSLMILWEIPILISHTKGGFLSSKMLLFDHLSWAQKRTAMNIIWLKVTRPHEEDFE